MTGFSRVEGHNESAAWSWEIRSVNGKNLDVRMRVPPGFEALEVPARKMVSEAFRRGNLQTSLQVSQQSQASIPVLNEAAANAALEIARKLQAQVGGELPDAAQLMAIRGILETGGTNQDADELEALHAAMLKSLGEAVAQLSSMREAEGSAVGALLRAQVEQIANLTGQIEASKARSPDSIKETLSAQIERVIGAAPDFDEARVYQEAVILAAKADIQEELDRLKVHIEASRELLAGEGAAGRKLDFLAQEFNRECNTICSKSNAAEVTSAGLEMKIVIDQFREQLQNLE